MSQGVMLKGMVTIGWIWEFNSHVMLSIGLLQDWDRIYTIHSTGTMTQFGFDHVFP